DDLVRQLAAATVIDPDRPVRIDRYLEGIEVDVDAVSDGERVLIPGLLEHVERAGVHSGDSVGLFPPQSVSPADQGLIVTTMERVVLALGARGLVNAQFIVREDGVYLIEVNPRASRTVPFLSKVTGVPMVELAVRIALGASLLDLGWAGGLLPPPGYVSVRDPTFSTADGGGRRVEGSMPDLVSVIRSGGTRLVVNTPTPRSGPVRDAAEIRHAAIAEGVPCLTAIETAVAAAEALDPDIAALVSEVRSLEDWLAARGSTRQTRELVPSA